MKSILIILFTSAFIIAKAAPVKPYLVIIKTSSGKSKGVLCYIDSTGLIIDQKEGIAKIKTETIQSIKIRKLKKHYQVKQLVKYDPWNERNFEYSRSGYKKRKNNEEDPTLEDEITGHLGATIFNMTFNLIAAPFHAINPAIYSNRNFNMREELDNLRGFSLFYQQYPEMLRLQALKL